MPKLFPTLSFALATFAPACLQAKQVILDEGVRQLIQTYCIQCHGPNEDKGDRTFHELGQKKDAQWVVNLADSRKADLLQDVLDQLNLGEMPPKKTDVKQPKSVETKQAIAWLTKVLLDFEEERVPRKPFSED